MPLKLLLAQFSLFDLLLAPTVDNVGALEVDLVPVPNERIFPPFALFFAFSVGNTIILVIDSLNLNLANFVIFLPWGVGGELGQGWIGLVVGLASALRCQMVFRGGLIIAGGAASLFGEVLGGCEGDLELVLGGGCGVEVVIIGGIVLVFDVVVVGDDVEVALHVSGCD